MQMTFSITYYCRKCKVNKGSKLAPIEISICINGERWLITLPRKANPDDFKKEMRSIKQTPLKTYTSAVSAKIESLQTRLLMEGRPFTKEAVREFIYFGFTDNHYTMGYLFDLFLQSQYKKVEAKISTLKNYRKYEIVRDLLYKNSDIKAETHLISIHLKNIIDFNTFLLSKYDSTTVAGMMQKLKSVILFGLRNRIMTDNPFLGFTISRKQKEVEFLTQEEIKRIKTAQMPTSRMEIYRDLFLFQCYTCLSFKDMENLVPSDFKKNEYGYIYVEKERAKTGVKFCAIMFEDAEKIAERYDYKLPTVHVQNYNNGLKLIADICHIDKPMHSHIGRHSGACYLLNEKHLPLDVVAKILGHATTKITRHYAKLMDRTVFEAVAKSERQENGV